MVTDKKPRISFGIIVLNGEPYTRYCIRSIYPFAHEIIVVEGACVGASKVATLNGHSCDGSLEILRKMKAEEDPDNKIHIITAEDEGHADGFWPGEKNEQSRAYARRASGNYLWQVDIDEFYKAEDIHSIIQLLENDPEITAVSFKQIQFWGGFDYYVDSWYLRRGGEEFHRLFKWGEGYQYTTHRPPTIVNEEGIGNRSVKWIRAKETSSLGWYLYHYSFVFPKQVIEKASYYGNSSWARLPEADNWANSIFSKLSNPYRVFINYNSPSWLERFKGVHPAVIQQMKEDIIEGKLHEEVRETGDIEKLLNSLRYTLGKLWLKSIDRPSYTIFRYSKSFRRKFKKLYTYLTN